MGKKSKSESGPPKWAKPYVVGGINSAQGVYDQQKGNIADISGQVQDMIPGLMSKFEGGNPALTAATGYATDVLGGKYMDGNPFLEDMIGQTNQSVGDTISARFGSRGSFGGTKWAEGMGEGLGRAELGLRYGNYSDEMNRMAGAAGMAPGLNQAEYAGVAPILAASQTGAQLPFTGINNLTSNISGLIGNSGTQTQGKNGAGNIAEGIGTALSIASMFSDRRLKTNIRKIGEYADGLGRYVWTYVWGERAEGVMADEVAELRPWALGPEVGGYATVDYNRL